VSGKLSILVEGKTFMRQIFISLIGLAIFILGGFRAAGQSFSLEGLIDADSGMVYLNYVSDDAYYRHDSGSLEAEVHKGKFLLRDSLASPCAFQLLYKADSVWKYISGIFLLQPGDQTIRCHVDSMFEIPDVDNAGTREWKAWAMGMLEKDTGMYRLAYVRAHPDSYVVLWDLISILGHGYKPIFDSIYEGLSAAIKSSYPGMVLRERLRSLAQTAQGRIFPAAVLADEREHEVRFSGSTVHARYTLVDFWFSHCDPCIRRFRELKAVYMKHGGQDLEIVAISTDGQKDLGEWRAVIQREGFDWKQYLDKGGSFAHQLSISSYPTNFLLDEKGVIIKRDIMPAELEKMLDGL
jgi:thiol-disulfide isomerase/thioredoxin